MTKTLTVAGFVAAGFMAVSVASLAAQPQVARQQPVAAAQPAQAGSPTRASSTQPPSAQSSLSQTAASQTAASQPPSLPSSGQPASPVKAAPKLEAVIGQIQKATLSMNANIARLRIEKWRTDADQKEQLQKLASSLQRNVTYAVPGLISDVQNSRGSVSSAFKLYHDVNVVYEYLNSLTDAAGSLGRKEEYDPLAEDAAALDSAREGLSSYIEQTAIVLETPPKPSANAVSSAEGESAGGRKIIVEEVSGKPAKPTKKKTSTVPAKPAATPAPGKPGAASGKANPPSAAAKPSAASALGKANSTSASVKANSPSAAGKSSPPSAAGKAASASANPSSSKPASTKSSLSKSTTASAAAAAPTPAPK